MVSILWMSGSWYNAVILYSDTQHFSELLTTGAIIQLFFAQRKLVNVSRFSYTRVDIQFI